MKDLFGQNAKIRNLRARYIVPPFSVLDTKHGDWQSRKRQWLKLGIQSEIGRFVIDNNKSFQACDRYTTFLNKAKKSKSKHHRTFHDGLDKLTTKTAFRDDKLPVGMTKGGDSLAKKQGVSGFDPVLCELMYKWFCPACGEILDPFAGSSVGGIVAHYLDYTYTGIELNGEQVEANRQQAKDVLKKKKHPKWITGDSEAILFEWIDKGRKKRYDFIFTSPPYMDLEIYSRKPEDLSNMSDKDFITKYESIVELACSLLKPNCYACFVIGDVRDKKGYYKDFITITKQAFYKARMKLYNDMILLNIIGSACLRTAAFEASQKVIKIHQNVLVFKKLKG